MGHCSGSGVTREEIEMSSYTPAEPNQQTGKSGSSRGGGRGKEN